MRSLSFRNLFVEPVVSVASQRCMLSLANILYEESKITNTLCLNSHLQEGSLEELQDSVFHIVSVLVTIHPFTDKDCMH